MRLEGEPLWALSLYPEAGEGGGCLTGLRSPEPRGNRPEPGRSASEAARRARGRCAATALRTG